MPGRSQSSPLGTSPAPSPTPLRPAFATWIGWLLPPDVPLVVVLDPDQDAAQLAWQAAKIGYDHLAGTARRRPGRLARRRRTDRND
ncbi:hypothetical protein [Streptomyces melanogenes]|uniref:hypothetical protein n=1 Tax=Streptomyces melanogenes TaxID=67326 RepID=UPI00379BD4BB